MILRFAQWIQLTEFFTYLRGSAYTYPVVLSLHMVAIAFFGGMILMTDLRMLGWAMTRRPVSHVMDQLRVPKRFGFLLVATSGILMLGSKAEEYYYNVFFRTKLVLLALVVVHALVFRKSVYDQAAEFDRAGAVPGRAAGGKVGGKKRAEMLSPEKRAEIAKKGATARWKKENKS